MAMLLFAYAARKRLSPTAYALLNLAGAILVGIDCVRTETWPAVALEVAWSAIAISELYRAFRVKRPVNA